MEPVTHFLTGAALGRSGFNRKTALATLTMTLAAEAGDIDIIAYARGDVFGFAQHRGFTHTLIGLPVVAGLTVGLVYLLDRLWLRKRREGRDVLQPRWGLLYLFACIACVSHILLDFTNNYGVRPFWPFLHRWYSWDIVFIVEPVMLLLLAAGLVLPWFFGLIGSEIGARSRGPRGRGAAIAALLGVVAMWGVRDYEHRRAVAALDALEYQGQAAQRVAAYPHMINPFAWSGVVETATDYELMNVNSLKPEVDPSGRTEMIYKPEQSPAIQAARESRLGQVYLDWSKFPLITAEKLQAPETGTLVHFQDLRFRSVDSRRSALGAYVLLDEQNRVLGQGFGSAPKKLQ